MGKVAFIFPGQGAQYVGMGKEISSEYDVADKIFKKADEILGHRISDVCFNGPEESLKDTRNAQPAIMVTSLALLEVLKSEGCDCDFVAGHSLGEYSALVAAGVLSLEDALKLVAQRSALMADADVDQCGAMAAVLGLDRAAVNEALKVSAGKVDAANFNCPGQIVVSGEKTALQAVGEAVVAAGGKFIPLAVSGAFHSQYMKPAAEKYLPILKQATWNEPSIPLVSNVDASLMNRETIVDKMYRQLFSSVLWEDTLNYLADQGVDTFIEIGPGKVLSGLVKKTLKGVTFTNCEDLNSVKKALAILKEV